MTMEEITSFRLDNQSLMENIGSSESTEKTELQQEELEKAAAIIQKVWRVHIEKKHQDPVSTTKSQDESQQNKRHSASSSAKRSSSSASKSRKSTADSKKTTPKSTAKSGKHTASQQDQQQEVSGEKPASAKSGSGKSTAKAGRRLTFSLPPDHKDSDDETEEKRPVRVATPAHTKSPAAVVPDDNPSPLSQPESNSEHAGDQISGKSSANSKATPLSEYSDDAGLNLPKTGETTITTKIQVSKEQTYSAIKSYKHYTGGYKDTINGKIYFNAYAQTLFAHQMQEPKTKFHRDCQTVDIHHRITQTNYTQSTQTPRRDLLQTSSYQPGDKILYAKGTHVTADEFHRHRTQAATKIQSFYRKMKAIQLVRSMKYDKEMDDEFKGNLNLARERVKLHLQSNMPEALLSSQQWKSVMDSLDDSLANYQEALKSPLEKALVNAGKPLTWRAKHQKPEDLALDSPEMRRARELYALAQSLKQRDLPAKQRLKLLHNLKYTVSEFKSRLTEEIIFLIDRETDWISRGRSKHSLEACRLRLDHLFLIFMKTAEYNPAILRIDYMRPEKDDEPVQECAACLRYLPLTKFKHANKSSTGPAAGGSDGGADEDSDKAAKCDRCLMEFFESHHMPTDKYLFSLKMIMRMEERIKRSQMKAMFGIKDHQESRDALFLFSIDKLRDLVLRIWKSESFFGESEDDRKSIPVEDLVFTRWNIMKPISPYNCILLSVEQASQHDKYQLGILANQEGTPEWDELNDLIESSLNQHYPDSVRQRVEKNHEQARKGHFHLTISK